MLKTVTKYLQLNYKFTALIFIIFILAGCSASLGPIDADDFGFPKITVPASGKNVTGTLDNELSEWSFSGYKYNGDNPVVMVYNPRNNISIWSSWWGNGEGILTLTMQDGPNCCIGTLNADGSCNTQYCANPSAKIESIPNAACNFIKGQGLYMLLTNPSNTNITDPNTYPNVNRMPGIVPFFTVGLWQPTGMYQNGQPTNGYIGTNTTQPISSTYVNGAAYFKILDSYYDDNSGAFIVSLKNGFSAQTTPPIARTIQLITRTFNDAGETIFRNLVGESEYIAALKALLSLYIIVYGIMYVGGVIGIEKTQTEFVRMMIKLVLVVQLFNQSSWSLFNNYFFNFFTLGLNDMIRIVTTNIVGGTGGTGGLTFFDAMIGLFFSYETTMKIIALIFSFPSGIVAAAMTFLSFLIFTLALARAVILYLLSYMATVLVISLTPIFITFLLFEQTRSLFEKWVSQFVAYFFQPLLIFGGLALLAQVIINQMYRLLGFRACYNNWITVINTPVVKAWQICSFNSNSAIKTTIPVPGYGFWNSNDSTYFCQPYECTATRYVDLPFLDPSKDSALINDFNSPYTNLNLPMLYNSLMLLISTFILFKFIGTLPIISKAISDGGVNLSTAANSAVSNLWSGLQGFGTQAYNFTTTQMVKMIPSKTIRKGLRELGNLMEERKRLAKEDIDENKKSRLFKFIDNNWLNRTIANNYNTTIKNDWSEAPGVTQGLSDAFSAFNTTFQTTASLTGKGIYYSTAILKNGLTYIVKDAFRDRRADITSYVSLYNEYINATKSNIGIANHKISLANNIMSNTLSKGLSMGYSASTYAMTGGYNFITNSMTAMYNAPKFARYFASNPGLTMTYLSTKAKASKIGKEAAKKTKEATESHLTKLRDH